MGKLKKISKTKISSTYGLALYEAALLEKNVKSVFDDVVRLYDVVKNEQEIVSLLSNPVWNVASKKEALKEIAKNINLKKETVNCLDIVADNGRFRELPQILADFIHVYHEKNNIVEVKVYSVKKLSALQSKNLQNKMEKKLGSKIVLYNEVDPNILGGLRIVYGSNMIDASLENKINRLEIVMKGGL